MNNEYLSGESPKITLYLHLLKDGVKVLLCQNNILKYHTNN